MKIKSKLIIGFSVLMIIMVGLTVVAMTASTI